MGNTTTRANWPPTTAVHPHACGEYRRQAVVVPVVYGSPPRLWGIRRRAVIRRRDGRFTPTPVGNTSRPDPRDELIAVHPHACGEYCCSVSCPSGFSGSPPRLWGIRQNRISLVPVKAVHPHACGEYAELFLCGDTARRFTPTPVGNTLRQYLAGAGHGGSPPRLWGIRPPPAPPALPRRFTPTPVGNTALRVVAPNSPTVHPHACGEYLSVGDVSEADSGSPPRLWGIPAGRRRPCQHCRFTPTPVGNTCRVHFNRSAASGSPPRLWGIPAQPSCGCEEPAVHPHACGEYLLQEPARQSVSGSPPRLWGIRGRGSRPRRPVGGSPPRLWGIPAVLCAWPQRRRFTPTPVGNTPVGMGGCLCSAGSPPRLWGIRLLTAFH